MNWSELQDPFGRLLLVYTLVFCFAATLHSLYLLVNSSSPREVGVFEFLVAAIGALIFVLTAVVVLSRATRAGRRYPE